MVLFCDGECVGVALIELDGEGKGHRNGSGVPVRVFLGGQVRVPGTTLAAIAPVRAAKPVTDA